MTNPNDPTPPAAAGAPASGGVVKKVIGGGLAAAAVAGVGYGGYLAGNRANNPAPDNVVDTRKSDAPANAAAGDDDDAPRKKGEGKRFVLSYTDQMVSPADVKGAPLVVLDKGVVIDGRLKHSPTQAIAGYVNADDDFDKNLAELAEPGNRVMFNTLFLDGLDKMIVEKGAAATTAFIKQARQKLNEKMGSEAKLAVHRGFEALPGAGADIDFVVATGTALLPNGQNVGARDQNRILKLLDATRAEAAKAGRTLKVAGYDIVDDMNPATVTRAQETHKKLGYELSYVSSASNAAIVVEKAAAIPR